MKNPDLESQDLPSHGTLLVESIYMSIFSLLGQGENVTVLPKM